MSFTQSSSVFFFLDTLHRSARHHRIARRRSYQRGGGLGRNVEDIGKYQRSLRQGIEGIWVSLKGGNRVHISMKWLRLPGLPANLTFPRYTLEILFDDEAGSYTVNNNTTLFAQSVCALWPCQILVTIQLHFCLDLMFLKK